jgi:DNA (cytosine-5)-methyltransferase 1
MLDYVRRLNETLIPNDSLKITVLDLFAGCGGLALGFESVGFSTVGFEKDHDAAQTYASNLEGHCLETKLNTDSEYSLAQVIIGGLPVSLSVLAEISRGSGMNVTDFRLFWRLSEK